MTEINIIAWDYEVIFIIKTKIQLKMILPTDFPLVVGTGVLMCWQVWAFGAQVGQKRHQIFNEDYMRK